MRTSLAALALLLTVPSAARAMPMDGASGPTVSMDYAAYAPASITALLGDTVVWRNGSLRAHTVTAEDGTFDSARIESGGGFAVEADRVGDHVYYCRLHTFMRGDVDVRRLLLDTPREPTAPGRPYVLTGRAALDPGVAARVQADTGAGFEDVGRATVGDSGALQAPVRPAGTTSYRVVSGGDVSPPVTVFVLDRKVSATASTRGRRATVQAAVTPPSPGATLVLQLRLRDHFGWWPVARAKAGADGRTTFRVPVGRRVKARVVLTLADGATRLAESQTLRVGR